MTPTRFLPALSLGIALSGALWWAKTTATPFWLPSPVATETAPLQTQRAPYDPQLVQKTLEFYASQVRYDPQSAITRALLAGQYLESYRETGDAADATRAEQAARASLKIRTHRNSAAYFQLSRALLTQHRFREALEAARKAAKLDPIGFRECADIEIELGDYAAAARDLVKAPPVGQNAGQDPAYMALQARFYELHGDTQNQIALLTRAAKIADDSAQIPVQTVAWFHERLGRALGMNGQLDAAKTAYLSGLKEFPRDYRTMAALSHLEAARGNWKEAISWGQKAAQIVPAPETLALLGDAYAALGQTKQAKAQFALIENIGKLSRAQGIIYDRQRALFLADHGRNSEEAVTLARGELKVRHDIYAYDTLGWTLFKAGRLEEAAANAKRALAFGTRDASLWFHAGMVAAAQKNSGLARRYLERALSINPRFHPTQPAQARATLAALGSSSSSAGSIG